MNVRYSSIKKYTLSMQRSALTYVRDLVVSNIFEIQLFLLIAFVAKQYTRIPYVNILISPLLYYLFLLVVAFRLFMPNSRQALKIALIGFLALIPLTLSHMVEAVEMVGNVIYLLLLFVCFSAISGIRKNHE